MSDDALRRRLRRLGRRQQKSAHAFDGQPDPQGLPPGEHIDTPFGQAFRIVENYPHDFQHGSDMLARFFEFDSTLAAEIVRQPPLKQVALDRLAFIDTETTGLVGGAGTIAFLVGVGMFVGDTFRLRQYFLRDPGEEGSLLYALQEDLENAAGFVSFNGRAFDVPLLEIRYMLGLRRHWPLNSMPQMDLLYPSRRLWRYELPDCSLATIERSLLDVQRSEADVPGELIPGMYLEYLRSGDASEMKRVLYHNAIDILSLVGLAIRVMERHRQQDPNVLSAPEALAVARWHLGEGRLEPAEAAFHAALSGEDDAVRLEALRRYTTSLKREGRYDEAVEHWKSWHAHAPDDVRPCLELAKYYEWHRKDLVEAQHWANQALLCLSHWQADWRREQMWSEIEHRLKRLARKLSS